MGKTGGRPYGSCSRWRIPTLRELSLQQFTSLSKAPAFALPFIQAAKKSSTRHSKLKLSLLRKARVPRPVKTRGRLLNCNPEARKAGRDRNTASNERKAMKLKQADPSSPAIFDPGTKDAPITIEDEEVMDADDETEVPVTSPKSPRRPVSRLSVPIDEVKPSKTHSPGRTSYFGMFGQRLPYPTPPISAAATSRSEETDTWSSDEAEQSQPRNLKTVKRPAPSSQLNGSKVVSHKKRKSQPAQVAKPRMKSEAPADHVLTPVRNLARSSDDDDDLNVKIDPNDPTFEWDTDTPPPEPQQVRRRPRKLQNRDGATGKSSTASKTPNKSTGKIAVGKSTGRKRSNSITRFVVPDDFMEIETDAEEPSPTSSSARDAEVEMEDAVPEDPENLRIDMRPRHVWNAHVLGKTRRKKKPMRRGVT